MMNFVALYRGPSVSEARLVAVSSEREIVNRFIRDLTGENAEGRLRTEPPEYAVKGGVEELLPHKENVVAK
jgi:hypothetical protein